MSTSAKLSEACEVFGKAYDILVEFAGASKNHQDRLAFVSAFTHTESKLRTSEWRFQGTIGFGGKFYYDGWGPMRIDCYVEERSRANAKTIETVNKKLGALPQPGHPPYEAT